MGRWALRSDQSKNDIDVIEAGLAV